MTWQPVRFWCSSLLFSGRVKATSDPETPPSWQITNTHSQLVVCLLFCLKGWDCRASHRKLTACMPFRRVMLEKLVAGVH